MSIPVVCSCGKSMRAPAEWAGRDAKCPGCGQAVHIPGHGTAAAMAPVKTSNPPVTPCPGCGKPLLVPPGMAGKLVACPACGGHVRLPGKPVGVTAKAPKVTVPAAPAPAPRPKSKPQMKPKPATVATFEMDDPDDDFEEEDDHYRESRRGKKRTSARKKKAGSGRLLLLCGLGGGGALLVVGLIVGLIFLLPGRAPAGPLALVPSDAAAFMLVRMGDFGKTASADTIRKLGGEKDGKFGIAFDEVREVVIIFSTKSFKQLEKPIVALSTSKPISVAAIQASEAGKDLTKKEVGGKTLLVSAQPNQPSMLVHGSNMLLVGDEAAITALSANPPKGEAGPLTPKLRAAAASSDMLFFGYQVPPELAQMAGPMGGPMGGGMGMKLSFISDVKSGELSLREDRTIHGRLTLDFADAAKASKAKDDLDATLGMARMMMPAMKGQMPGINPKMMALAEKALDKARPVAAGNSVEIPLEYETTIGELIDQAKPMMGMFGPGMGGMPGPGMGGMPPGPRPGPAVPQPKNPGKNKRR